MTEIEVFLWYEKQPQDVRMKLQAEFGNDGIANREAKFYQWLIKEKKYEQ